LPNTTPDKKRGSLYLARTVLGNTLRFSLRQTVMDDQDEFPRHRQLVDLGDDPARYLVFPSSNCFYVHDDLLATVAPMVEGDVALALEKILWPFVRADVRANLASVMAREHGSPPTKVTAAEQEAIDRELHLFDRRRLHYLWYGAIDQSGLYRMPAKLCRRLLGKSRDEKEQYFIDREMVLYADQVKEYLYTIFNLQRHFSESFARILPQGLDQQRLDTLFIDELCSLNRDASLWRGMPPVDGLHPYLIRHLILFFDYEFSAAAALSGYFKTFMDSHRQFHFPQPKSTMSTEELSTIFGEPAERLATLSKRELKALFRKRAKALHPDIGGDPEQFVRLKEAFEALHRKRGAA